MASISSHGYIINGDKPDIINEEPIKLQEGIGYDGVLQSLEDGPIGLIIVNISGHIIELPRILKSRLEPLLGQPVRVAFLCGKYHACKMTRRA